MNKNMKALLEDERPTIAMCYGIRRCFLLSPLLSLSERSLKTLTNQNLKKQKQKGERAGEKRARSISSLPSFFFF